ncbi:VanZ family protein [Emticicia sp. SJ17W-69]|uniref:VanZ family protein n=1 Tax=Emticicia sp. SJ17W-69 TaxID=3421657 RepID=UPI003EB834A5
MKLKTLALRFLENKYLAFAITLIIFVLCTVPSDQLPKSEDFNDKTAHFIVFAGWAFCWQFAFKDYKKTILLGIIYGILIEFWQGSLPISFHRSFDWYDALADSIGVVIGLIVVFIINVLGLKK